MCVAGKSLCCCGRGALFLLGQQVLVADAMYGDVVGVPVFVFVGCMCGVCVVRGIVIPSSCMLQPKDL